jgi:hypothetical protein
MEQILVGIHFATECHFLCGCCEFSKERTGFVSGWPCQLAYGGIVWTQLKDGLDKGLKHVANLTRKKFCVLNEYLCALFIDS